MTIRVQTWHLSLVTLLLLFEYYNKSATIITSPCEWFNTSFVQLLKIFFIMTVLCKKKDTGKVYFSFHTVIKQACAHRNVTTGLHGGHSPTVLEQIRRSIFNECSCLRFLPSTVVILSGCGCLSISSCVHIATETTIQSVHWWFGQKMNTQMQPV